MIDKIEDKRDDYSGTRIKKNNLKKNFKKI